MWPLHSSPQSIRLFTLLVVLGIVALAPATAWSISTELLLDLQGEAGGDKFGSSVSSAGDFNGDGYPDVVVGAYKNNSGAGRVYVYYGGPAADDVADLTLDAQVAGEAFGFSVGGAGDMNGDGFDDLVVGAYLNDAGGSDAGRAYVFFGGAAPNTGVDLTLTGTTVNGWFGHSVGPAGDVNGDGYDDVLVGQWAESVAGFLVVYYGSASPDNVADFSLLGPFIDDVASSASTAGDLNGDGYSDVVLGSFNSLSGAGRVKIRFGGSGLTMTLVGSAAGDSLGVSVAGAGDVNGDGYDDLIVGAHGSDTGGSGSGAAYIYFGGADFDTTADLIIVGAEAGDGLGTSVASAGDVNGDGYNDIIIGAHGKTVSASQVGDAYVYFGGPALDGIPDIGFFSSESDGLFGFSVSTAGDLDGDGFDEFVVGVPDTDSGDPGQARIYSPFPYRIESPNGGELWPTGEMVTVSWRGHDVADLDLSLDRGLTWSRTATGIGGSDHNEYSLRVPAVTSEAALVRLTYTGQAPAFSNSAISSRAFWIGKQVSEVACRSRLAFSGAGADRLGYSVAGAGDVNGDGFADVIVGAHGNDTGGSNIGQAYVLFGGAGADSVPDLVFTGEVAEDNFGYSVAGAGDVNGDGYDDVIVGAYENDEGGAGAGRAYVYYCGPGADAVADLTFTGGTDYDNLGISVSGAGDFNGDGYDDLIVGAWGEDTANTDAGAASVYFGGPAADNAADLKFSGEAYLDVFGKSVSAAGDVNGDGYDDVIVGAPYSDSPFSNAGRAYVFYGGPSADSEADWVFSGEAVNDWFGHSVSGSGDVNGDGYDDVMVGAVYNDAGGNRAGRVYLYFGGPFADTVADLILTGEAANDYFGESVSSAGDINSDGYSDLIVGAYGNDAGGAAAGRAYVYYGGPGMDDQADLIMTGEAPGDELGRSVSAAGDMRGDGFGDLVVGASESDVGGFGSGRAFMYDCNRYQVLSPSGAETWHVGAEETISWSGSEPADLWLSTDGGNSYVRLRDNVGAAPFNSVSLTVPHQPTRFAKIKITPHDLGVSGSSESDSLFTIETMIALLNLQAKPIEGGGVLLSWETDPGPDDLAGYKVERLPGGGGSWHVLAPLTRETTYHDVSGSSGMRYRLSGVNGLGEELVLGETGLAPSVALGAWPLPYRGGDLHVSFLAGAAGKRAAATEVAVFDINGRLVRTLATGEFDAGRHETVWDGLDSGARPVVSGVYFLRCRTGAESHHLKVVISR